MGRVFKFHNDVDTDQIIASQYLLLPNIEEMKVYTFESIDKDFAKKVKEGDIVVAGENFGCGSSREHAPLAIKACGISCVIAASFARIFYRNAINIGLPIIESPQAANGILHGDKLEIDWKTGVIRNLTQNSTYQIGVFPEFIQDIINDGGLLASIKASLQLQENTHPTN